MNPRLMYAVGLENPDVVTAFPSAQKAVDKINIEMEKDPALKMPIDEIPIDPVVIIPLETWQDIQGLLKQALVDLEYVQ